MDSAFYEHLAAWSRLLSTLVFFGVLWWVWQRFIAPAVAKAQQTRNEEISEGERRLEAARSELKAAAADVTQAGEDAQAIVARARADARRDHERLLREAGDAGERAVRNADGELERARAAARDAVRLDLIEKAVRLARTEASARVDDHLQGALVESFVATLERSRN
jgi:F-type H+-transporting ATPase subunit b